MLRFVFLVGALLLGACQTTGTPQRGTELNPIAPPKGAQQALGAVLYLHGANMFNKRHQSLDRVPPMLDNLVRAGFDVYRLDLAPQDQNRDAITQRRLPQSVATLRDAKYRKVYVVGHSAGGVLAMHAIGHGRLADGAIAFAPGWNATEPVARQIAFHRAMLAELNHDRRIAIFHFQNDHLLLNWHADAVRMSRAAMAGRTDAMVRVPDLILGHDAAGEQAFADRYGDCLARFLVDVRADQSVCPP